MAAADQLRAARVRAGLTQQQLAGLSGVRQPNIAAYEGGQRRPSPAMLKRLLAAARPRPSTLLETNRAEIRKIAARHHAYDVRVFGSVARHADRSDSDLDLLVTFDVEATLLEHAALIDELEDLLGMPVDVVSAGALGERDETIRAEAVPV
jgi:predicted nucleotidyltransferase/DNA-binding XRE family transcriptional regulator